MLALPQFGHLLVPAAFAGALATAVLVYLLAWKRGVNPVRLILSGVAVAGMLGRIQQHHSAVECGQGGRRIGFLNRHLVRPELAADRTGLALHGRRDSPPRC